MTPEEFAELVAMGDAERIAEATASLSESQRRKLWKGVSNFIREVEVASWTPPGVKRDLPTLDAMRLRLGDRFHPDPLACTVATFAVGPLAEARKARGSWNETRVAPCIKVLCDRRPEWIQRWLEFRLQDRFVWRADWYLIRALIRQGICVKPQSEAYLHWMGRVMRPCADDGPKISQILVDDPEVLDDVWRLFEIETSALWLPEDLHVMGRPEGWALALARLAHFGQIDRQRLLDACLKSLSSGFKDLTLTQFMRFFRFLEPKPEELVARSATFLDLLANPASRVVTFALDEIRRIADAGQLDGERFLAAMPPVFHLRSKGQSKTALEIAARVVQSRPELLPHAVAGVLEALSHPAAEVQQKAVALLESWASRLHPDHATALRERLEDLAPSVRSRVEKLAGQLRPAGGPTQGSVDEELPRTLEELAGEAARLPSPWRERAGVDAALEALRDGRLPEPLVFDLLEARVLTGVAPIEPIGSVDELFDTVAHAIETLESADELERILDGISRFCAERPLDFLRRADPIVQRLSDMRGQGIRRLGPWDSVSDSFSRLLMAWLRGPAFGSKRQEVALYEFFDRRVQEVIQRVNATRAQPLLAAPTHHGGWIDPVVLVQRLVELVQSGEEPGKCDLIQALLRLAPDGRAEALAAATELPGSIGRAVRWALGDAEAPQPEDGHDKPLWLAAGRARNPSGTLEELPFLKSTEDLPDAYAPARYAWHASSKENGERRWWLLGYVPLAVACQPEAPRGDLVSMLPTVALHQRHEHHSSVPAWQCGFMSAAQIDAAAQVWPLCLDSFLVGAIEALGQRLDMPSSTLMPNHGYLRPWLEPDRPWSELATVAIWMGLVSKDAGSRTVALDVLIQAVADGRARPAQMADVLLRMLPGYWVKLNRVAELLAEVARLSAAHAWFVAETLQAIVAGLEEVPRDLHRLLMLLLELLLDLGAELNPQARCRLETLQGTNKAAKTAASLRKLAAQEPAAKLRQAGLEILESRIARAQRWSQ